MTSVMPTTTEYDDVYRPSFEGWRVSLHDQFISYYEEQLFKGGLQNTLFLLVHIIKNGKHKYLYH